MVSSLTAPTRYQKCNQSFTRLASDLVHLHVAAWLHGCFLLRGAGKERMNQALVLGEWWYPALRMPIHKTYALDLKRAHSTAVRLVAPRTSLPDLDKVPLSFPLIHTTPLIREQHFGIAEGKLWLLDRYRKRSNSSSVGVHRRTTMTTTRSYWIPMRRSRGTIQYGIGTIGSPVASRMTISLRAEDAVEGLVWPHLDDAVAIATTIQIPVPVRIRMGSRSRSMVDHGKMERSTSKSEADSGTMSLSSAMGCASPRWSLPYSGGVRMPEQPCQRTCQYWLDASTHSSPGE